MNAPLDGVTVIDLSRGLAGPHPGLTLGEHDASVPRRLDETDARDDAPEQGRS